MKRIPIPARTYVVSWTLLFAMLAAPVFAQSPAFPTVQPYRPPLIRDFPYHKYRADERFGPVFPPEVLIFRRPQARPGDYPHTRGYGSSPFIRLYGGAGSTAQTPGP